MSFFLHVQVGMSLPLRFPFGPRFGQSDQVAVGLPFGLSRAGCNRAYLLPKMTFLARWKRESLVVANVRGRDTHICDLLGGGGKSLWSFEGRRNGHGRLPMERQLLDSCAHSGLSLLRSPSFLFPFRCTNGPFESCRPRHEEMAEQFFLLFSLAPPVLDRVCKGFTLVRSLPFFESFLILPLRISSLPLHSTPFGLGPVRPLLAGFLGRWSGGQGSDEHMVGRYS